MHKDSKYTQLKVIGGYTLLFLVGLLSAVLIYKQITKLVVNEGTTGNSNQKLFIIGNITTGLYEAEIFSNAFIQTGAQRYFQRYMLIMENTEENIDTLKKLTSRREQVVRIDSISLLLDEKITNLKDLAWIKRRFVPDDFYNKAIANITSGKDSIANRLNTRNRMVTTFDTSYIKTEKKKRSWLFFSKSEPDSIIHISPRFHMVTDTLNQEPLYSSTDSVINILKSTWEDVQKQTEDIKRQVNQREYALIQQSTYITDQLKRILSEYEKEELYHNQQKQVTREQTITTMIHIFAWLAAIAIVLVVFFTFFILRDLSRSQRYRRELESANQYTNKLLKSREKLILTVTHDIKSPLSSILGYIELLNNKVISEQERYFLKNMKGSSEHILQLIGNLLDLSKLENNKMPVEEVVFNPYQLFNEIKDNFIPLASGKHLILSSKFGKDLDGSYKGDALRIRQVITNILSNAIKYTSTGEITFTANSSTDDKNIIIKIKDTGSGMTPEEQKLIFEEFTRLKSHSTIEGTGLGLTITLKLIELLGGKITLDSVKEEGSCFTIVLPLKKTALNTLSHASVTSDQNTALPSDLKLNVLLVDDDPLQLEMTAGLLSRKNIQADTTTQPKEVIKLITNHSYNIIFSDIQMPQMDGFQLVKQIRALSSPLAQIPVIALSADSGKTEENYLQAGFTAYLPKPFTSDQLIHLIEKLLNIKFQENETVSALATSPNANYTLNHLIQFTDNDPEALKKIIRSFITSTEEHVKLLEEYLKTKQAEPITRLAHKMLPMFRQLETNDIVVLLEKLEQTDKTPLTSEAIKNFTREVICQIRQLLTELSGQL